MQFLFCKKKKTWSSFYSVQIYPVDWSAVLIVVSSASKLYSTFVNWFAAWLYVNCPLSNFFKSTVIDIFKDWFSVSGFNSYPLTLLPTNGW